MQKATLKMIKTWTPLVLASLLMLSGATADRIGQWALGTAARTAAMFDTGGPGPDEPRASGPLRLLPGDLPQGR